MKTEKIHPGTNRIEAFSDGVIAIVLTIMVFDLKLPEAIGQMNTNGVWQALVGVSPKFISYLMSFLVIAIMWVNHHQIFFQLKHVDGKLLWYNMHLLFWMTMIPFATNFIGVHPFLPLAAFFYGLVLFMAAFSFTLMRAYMAGPANLLHETISKRSRVRAQRKNIIGNTVYFLSFALAFVSIYISFVCFLIVPLMYCIPEKIEHEVL